MVGVLVTRVTDEFEGERRKRLYLGVIGTYADSPTQR